MTTSQWTRRCALWTFAALPVLHGCAGVDITPVSQDAVKKLHAQSDAGAAQGYVVYSPMLFVEVARVKKCSREISDGKPCPATELIDACSVGKPQLMIDYSRPFLVKSKSGLGKAGVQISIVDGWRLSEIKDESDNSQLLGQAISLAKVVGLASSDKAPQCPTGIYQWLPGSEGGQFKALNFRTDER